MEHFITFVFLFLLFYSNHNIKLHIAMHWLEIPDHLRTRKE